MPDDRPLRRLPRAVVLAAAALCLAAATATAERMQRIGSYEAHYSLVPTTLLKPDIAARYDLTRARDRALLNVSILEGGETPVRATVTGTVRDLLGTARAIPFREVLEGDAVYYLAEIRHDDQEVLRFTIDVLTPDRARHTVAFQQKLYREPQ